MEDIDVELSQLADLAHIQIGRREKRPLCNRCRRPVGVCWCRDLDGVRVSTSCRVVILQHPHEEKRCLRTAPILQAALPSHAYLEIKAKRFPFSRFPQLEDILTSPQSVLMYPGERATGLDTLPPVGPNQQPYNIIIIDGTWQQAKSMYHNCRHLHTLPQVCLSGQYVSKYVIRTQPTEDALSTVETAAIALATLEQNWSIYTTLLHPLQLLCQYQIKHGAVPHQSKEQMIASGRCRKPMGKRTFKKLRKCGAKQAEGTNLSSFITSIQQSNDTNEGTSERCEDREGLPEDYRMREHEDSNRMEKDKHMCEEQATTEVEEGLSRMEKQDRKYGKQEESTVNCMCEGRNHIEEKDQIGNEQVVVAKDCMTHNDGDGNCMGDQTCTEQKGLAYDCKKPEGLVEDCVKQEIDKGRNCAQKIEPKSYIPGERR